MLISLTIINNNDFNNFITIFLLHHVNKNISREIWVLQYNKLS